MSSRGPRLLNSGPAKRVLRYEAQPTRMFGSYNVTAHYSDGTSEALCYGTPHFCLGEAARRNAELLHDGGGRNHDATKRD